MRSFFIVLALLILITAILPGTRELWGEARWFAISGFAALLIVFLVAILREGGWLEGIAVAVFGRTRLTLSQLLAYAGIREVEARPRTVLFKSGAEQRYVAAAAITAAEPLDYLKKQDVPRFWQGINEVFLATKHAMFVRVDALKPGLQSLRFQKRLLESKKKRSESEEFLLRCINQHLRIYEKVEHRFVSAHFLVFAFASREDEALSQLERICGVLQSNLRIRKVKVLNGEEVWLAWVALLAGGAVAPPALR